MASMTGWPTDAAEGSVANEARWRSMARLFAPSGVVAGYLGEMFPTLAAGPVINVAAGAVWIDGHYAELTTPASEAATADGLLVVRFTPATNVFEVVWRDGATTLTQTSDGVFELGLARMAAGALTDIRTTTGVFSSSGRWARLTSQSIPSGAQTLITGHIVGHNTDPSLFTFAGGMVTVTRACILEVTAMAQFASHGTGYRELHLKAGWTSGGGGETDLAIAFSSSSTVPISLIAHTGPLRWTAGNFFMAKAFHNAGTAIDLSIADFNPSISVTRVG